MFIRKLKKSFFERIGLKKKSNPQPTETVFGLDGEEEEEGESSSSISSVDDEEEEEEEQHQEGPVPQINISSPNSNSVLQQPYVYDGTGKYIKVAIPIRCILIIFAHIYETIDKNKA